ncbi:sensor domain-containing diguanylate cyclase [Acinetobacter sp. WCHAc010034]|uniref:GGDEF domain-containing protein n=1 Tax=Acinetobacter sp. WCHAc010034 TaxID=1879049 RepID=UPI00083A5F07|nr:sensor domain-containing diguanylate cyclase [Acinetobacter sp. WCHAc010034]AYA04605.1 sensor domain-containing diguanylate cyclase [Acinetobacter sp. WCHAc010034]
MNNMKFKNFEEACQTVLSFLYRRFGFNLWMITRTEGNDWIVLQVEDNGYNVKPGQVFQWSDSYCSHMVKGNGPKIAPRSQEIPLYTTAKINNLVDIKAYIGEPLLNEDGSIFGTLCAIDPSPQSDSLLKESNLIELMGQLLSHILQAELREDEQIRQREKFELEALHDALTGVFNRRAWDQFISLEEARCKRYGHPASIIMIDINNLKITNDSLGHSAGDVLIQNTATTLKSCIRNNDIVARLGGDEFAILSLESNLKNIEMLSNRAIDALNKAGISAAIGIAMRNPTHGLLDAIREADEKMYKHKKDCKKTLN